MKTYLFKIFTEKLQTKFKVSTESSMITLGQVHKEAIDFLGKNAIEWEPNSLGYTQGFYITYEEVVDGKRQDDAVR